jgi:alpha-D-ribose 1-methylphosphonate 5-triphosphate synthase subunit PhnG
MSTEETTRQEWMSALALAPETRLREAWESLSAKPQYKVVRGPETGLVMVGPGPETAGSASTWAR